MQPRAKTAQLLLDHGVREPVALLGARGYFLNTMGKYGVNDRGIYDDSITITSPTCNLNFNANCDPSYARSGIATLKPGLWRYKLGIHGLSKPKPLQYEALVQAAEVVVIRDNQGEDKGWFGINIHRGSCESTSSLGCQTIYPDQWNSFIETVKDQLRRYEQKTVPYLLLEYQG